jgi:hypothetical protein
VFERILELDVLVGGAVQRVGAAVAEDQPGAAPRVAVRVGDRHRPALRHRHQRERLAAGDAIRTPSWARQKRIC